MTLAQWQKRFPGSRVPYEQALEIVRQLVDAFHTAHVEDAEHGVVSSAAIEIEEHADASLTVRLDGGAADGSGHVPGARRYRAPECWWGARQSSYTDQYALAALFVELVTGAAPFAEIFATDDVSVIRTAVCNQPPKLPEDCPRREALMRALAKDPRQRFRSCGEFLMALSHSRTHHGHHGHGHGHRHAEQDAAASAREPARKPQRKTRRPLGLVLFVAAFGVATFWAFRSGWLERTLRSLESGGGASRPSAAAPSAEALAQQKARVAQIEEEIRRQRVVADKALKDLQDFVEKGGSALLEVRRDTMRQELQRLQSELTALQGEVPARRRLEEALTQLASRQVAYGAVSSSIPADSEVAHAYAELVAEAGRFKTLSSQYTDKHPQVIAQKPLVEAAGQRYATAVQSALRQVQGELAAKERRLSELRSRIDLQAAETAKVEQECMVVCLRQSELEKTRERESRRLADLQQMEVRVRFDTAAPVATNAVPSAR